MPELTDYQKDVLRAAQENHIWINAFTLIGPSEATLADIGRSIVRMLKNEEDTIQGELHRPGAILAGIDGPSSRVLVVRVNQS